MSVPLVSISYRQIDHPTVLNLTGKSLNLNQQTKLTWGEAQVVQQKEAFIEGEKFSFQVGLNILYRVEGIVENVYVQLKDRPPEDESILYILHLDFSNPFISVEARYGDEVAKDLSYQKLSHPLTLYAPMDLPLDFYQMDGTHFQSIEGYVTKKNAHILFIILKHDQYPLWAIEVI